MTDRLAIARAGLRAALEPILPDRVEPYPLPLTSRSAAPRIWLGQATSRPITDGGIYTTFPVVAVVDGASHAQYAMLDQLHALIWDTAERLTNFEPLDATPTEIRLVDNNGFPLADTAPMRGVVVAVRTMITARTFCKPGDPHAALIPPIPVEVN